MTIPRVWLPVLMTAFSLSGCVGPRTRYDSEFFRERPEIWERNGAYHVRLYEPERDPVGYSIACTEVHENDVHVWLWPPHSSGSNPNRLLPLGISVSSGAPPNFFWKD